MNLDLTDEETAALLRELNGLIDGDRYFMSSRIQTLKAIRAKIRPEPVREPLSPPGGLSRPESRSERVGQDRSRMPTANFPLAPLSQTPSANCIFSLAGSMPTAEIRGLARWTRHGAGRHSRNRHHR